MANIDKDDARRSKIAVSIDVRNMTNDLSLIGQLLSQVNQAGFSTRLVFFDTDDAVLIKRFSDTRRRHPLSMDGLALVGCHRRRNASSCGRWSRWPTG